MELTDILANTASAKAQMEFQERMSNTAHQREVADLKKAGLNPVLSTHSQGASTPNGAEGDYSEALPAILSSMESLAESTGTTAKSMQRAVESMASTVEDMEKKGEKGEGEGDGEGSKEYHDVKDLWKIFKDEIVDGKGSFTQRMANATVLITDATIENIEYLGNVIEGASAKQLLEAGLATVDALTGKTLIRKLAGKEDIDYSKSVDKVVEQVENGVNAWSNHFSGRNMERD